MIGEGDGGCEVGGFEAGGFLVEETVAFIEVGVLARGWAWKQEAAEVGLAKEFDAKKD
jgi:hypothetical protein